MGPCGDIWHCKACFELIRHVILHDVAPFSKKHALLGPWSLKYGVCTVETLPLEI